MYQEAEKAIIDKFDEGKKKALEDLRSFSERKVASMKRVNVGFMENLRVMKKLREDVCKKEEMKIIVEIVDEVRRYKELEDNLAMNINKKGELCNFHGVGMFLPVMKLQFGRYWIERDAYEQSGLVCFHNVINNRSK
ncbi:hypothetical protein CAEBREN_04285 [Caenorhabditis brenneri]|uniref:Uncharacterized protein n=1 Tax=Caenorhabditis brenneri TaxID=135651 RepID=G0N3Q5_CAEBE|nr:hypothetical protein CAEBREN_04285 [Caenorhabditis brenneri]